MSTLRINGIEAKSDPTSASVNEKIKITNSKCCYAELRSCSDEFLRSNDKLRKYPHCSLCTLGYCYDCC